MGQGCIAEWNEASLLLIKYPGNELSDWKDLLWQLPAIIYIGSEIVLLIPCILSLLCLKLHS